VSTLSLISLELELVLYILEVWSNSGHNLNTQANVVQLLRKFGP